MRPMRSCFLAMRKEFGMRVVFVVEGRACHTDVARQSSGNLERLESRERKGRPGDRKSLSPSPSPSSSVFFSRNPKEGEGEGEGEGDTFRSASFRLQRQIPAFLDFDEERGRVFPRR